MLRGTRFPRVALAALCATAVVGTSGRARAAGAWISGSPLTPVEQRVAVAAGPARTTLWTSLRFEAAGGPMAIVVPAPAGSSLDFSSDAWFEALEVATAARVFPPDGVSPFCPGKSGPSSVFEIDGQIAHTQSLHPQDVSVLDDGAAVSAWAGQANLVVPPKLLAALNALTGVSFVGVRFLAPPGPGVTPTLRVSMTGAPAMLPLALTSAGASDLRVTAWMIGQGEADLIGGVKVALSPTSLSWNAETQASNYVSLRDTALSAGADTFLVEATGHASLVQSVPIAQGTAFVDGVVTTFFERAAAYGDGAFDAAACVAAATPALDQTLPVSAVCPRAAVGVITPAGPCTESPAPGEIDPKTLRCGPGADDLALALSGLVPAGTWLTRQSVLIAAAATGADTPLGFTAGMTVSPVLHCDKVDTAACGDAGSSSGGSSSGGSSTSSGSASGSSSGGASSGGVIVVGNGSGDAINVVAGVVDVAAQSADTCNCSGTDSTTSSACSGSTASSADGTSGDACSGSSGSSDSSSGSCSGSSGSSDSCSGSSGSSESCSGSSGSSESCSGSGGGGDICSGSSGDAFKCAVTGPRKARAPRLSVVLMLALAVVAPLRRRSRPRRRA